MLCADVLPKFFSSETSHRSWVNNSNQHNWQLWTQLLIHPWLDRRSDVDVLHAWEKRTSFLRDQDHELRAVPCLCEYSPCKSITWKVKTPVTVSLFQRYICNLCYLLSSAPIQYSVRIRKVVATSRHSSEIASIASRWQSARSQTIQYITVVIMSLDAISSWVCSAEGNSKTTSTWQRLRGHLYKLCSQRPFLLLHVRCTRDNVKLQTVNPKRIQKNIKEWNKFGINQCCICLLCFLPEPRRRRSWTLHDCDHSCVSSSGICPRPSYASDQRIKGIKGLIQTSCPESNPTNSKRLQTSNYKYNNDVLLLDLLTSFSWDH